MRDDDRRLGNCIERAIDRFDAPGAVEVLTAHRRHSAHWMATGFEFAREQRLPVCVDVIAQAGDDEDSRLAHDQAAALRR